jgi:UDP-N-acetylmuramate--alanine ligase
MSTLGGADTVPADHLGVVHFIGIGGGGMSGIARIMLTRGSTVTGSDAKEARVLAALRVLGAKVYVGHDAANLGAADTVVVSTAIQESNPELIEARARGLRILPRAAALASVMAGRRGIAVAGTHGKTTTTSMLARALQHCGEDPSFAIGADLNEPGSNAHDGGGEIFVAEADESDESFLLLAPFAAIVTNIEADHLNHYAGLAEIHQAFERFAARIASDGFLVVCADDPGAMQLARSARAAGVDVRTYGEAPDADVRIVNLELAGTGSSFHVIADGRRLGEVVLRVPGRHNALNAAAATTIGLGLDVPFAEFAAGLTVFTGARRRFEPKGVVNGVRVYDDYAHHPTEVAATLTAAREVVGGGRLVVSSTPLLPHRRLLQGVRPGARARRRSRRDGGLRARRDHAARRHRHGACRGCHVAARARRLRTIMVGRSCASCRARATWRSGVDVGCRGRCRDARTRGSRGAAARFADDTPDPALTLRGSGL